MSIADEIEKLQALHAQGALTDDEFSRAKAELLAQVADEQPPVDVDALSEEVEYLRIENEINRLDLAWEHDRKAYMIRGYYGGRFIPTEESSFLNGGAMILLGLFFACSNGVGFLETLFVVGGIGVGLYMYKKAKAYQQAEQHYQEQRSDLAFRRNFAQRNRS